MDIATRYRATYFQELKKVSDGLRKRILECKDNPDIQDVEVRSWIKSVIDLAESQEQKEAETQAMLLKNNKKPEPKLDTGPKRG